MVKETTTAEIEAAAPLISIERLRECHKTPAAVLSGVMAQQGWRKGRCVAEADYLAAVKRFQEGLVK